MELGGGSGYYSKKFLSSVSTRHYTFVEPSIDMLELAKKRLPRYVDIIDKDALSALNQIEKRQDMFIFQRSLYSFYGTTNEYRPLLKIMYEKSNDNAVVAVSEMVSQYDLKQLYDYFYVNRSLLGLDNDEDFARDWQILKDVLEEYNYNVKNGIFTHFYLENIKPLFESEGFELIENFETNFYFRRS